MLGYSIPGQIPEIWKFLTYDVSRFADPHWVLVVILDRLESVERRCQVQASVLLCLWPRVLFFPNSDPILAGHPKLRNDLRRPTMEEIGYRTDIFTLDGTAGSQRD